ncbi:MAG: transposase domain-containing protein [Lachnospiraceae bacterium]
MSKKQKENPLIPPKSETAKVNHLKPYLYFKYLLKELPKYWNGYENEFEKDFLKNLFPWSKQLPSEIRKTEK